MQGVSGKKNFLYEYLIDLYSWMSDFECRDQAGLCSIRSGTIRLEGPENGALQCCLQPDLKIRRDCAHPVKILSGSKDQKTRKPRRTRSVNILLKEMIKIWIIINMNWHQQIKRERLTSLFYLPALDSSFGPQKSYGVIIFNHRRTYSKMIEAIKSS